jgi:hypothetical protein
MVTSDLYEASVNVYHRCLELGGHLYIKSKKYAKQGLHQVSEVVEAQMDKHWPVIKPYYDQHILGNYKNHFEPHFQKHVVPRIEQLSTWYKTTALPGCKKLVQDTHTWYKTKAIPLFEQFVDNALAFYQKIIKAYGEQCRSSLKTFRKATKDNDFLKQHPPPKSFMELWGDSCSHPQESIDAFLQATLLLFGIIFYRRVLGITWWVVNFVLTILLTFTPLRFVISPRRKSKTPLRAKVEEHPVPDVSRSGSSSPGSSNGGPYRNTRNGTGKKNGTK